MESIKNKLLRVIEAEYNLQLEEVTREDYLLAKKAVSAAQNDAKNETGEKKLNILIGAEKKKQTALRILKKLAGELEKKSKNAETNLKRRLKTSTAGLEDDGTGLI